MQIGVDSFASCNMDDGALSAINTSDNLRNLIEQVEYADRVGLDIFGIGEHHGRNFLDSAPTVILGAAAARTQHIRLTSAVTILSSADPVRVFQNFATLDLLSQGRAEIVVGRGLTSESLRLFGLPVQEKISIFEEKLDLLLKIRENEKLTWSGKYRAPIEDQGVYPRPMQNPLPIWLGVGGTPASFVRAGRLGLPLMIAILGGEMHRFRSLVDLYREAGRHAGYSPDRLKVGVHAPGYVAETTEVAIEDFIRGYIGNFSAAAKERSMPTLINTIRSPGGALLVGNPEEVIQKILWQSESLGGIDRVTLQMGAADLPHAKIVHAIELLGTRVAPILRNES